MILGLTKPDTGEILVENQDTFLTENWKALVAAYLDENFLIDHLTPQEYFDFIIRISGAGKQYLEDIRKLIEPFTDESFTGDKYIRDYSKGNKQKIGIIAALLRGCPYLLLDEPFSNLDPSSQIRLKHILQKANSDFGVTILLSSHDLLHVTEICDRIILLEKGQVAKDVVTSSDTLADLTGYFIRQLE